MIFPVGADADLIKAVRKIAAEEILPRFRSLVDGDIATKSRMDDLVTIADRETERRIGEVAEALLPGVTVVGEEAVSEDAKVRDAIDHSTCLIVDPVDGTWNFANGLATFGFFFFFFMTRSGMIGLLRREVRGRGS